MEKIDARKLSTNAQQQLRYQVIRLRKQGRKHSEISAITGVSRCTCSTWWTLYKNEGKKALKIKKRGRPLGSCRTLTPEQEKMIQKSTMTSGRSGFSDWIGQLFLDGAKVWILVTCLIFSEPLCLCVRSNPDFYK